MGFCILWSNNNKFTTHRVLRQSHSTIDIPHARQPLILIVLNTSGD